MKQEELARSLDRAELGTFESSLEVLAGDSDDDLFLDVDVGDGSSDEAIGEDAGDVLQFGDLWHGRCRLSGSGGSGVAADDAELLEVGLHPFDGVAEGWVGAMTVAVDEEEICAESLSGWARFDSGEVDVGIGEVLEGAEQCAGSVGGAEEDGGTVVAGWRVVLVVEDDEASRVAMVVLDAELEDVGLVELGSASRRDCGDAVADLDRSADGLCGRKCGLGAGLGKATIEVALALSERLGMGIDDIDLGGVGAGRSDQTVLDGDDKFVANLEVELMDDQVVRLADGASERVLEGDDGDVGVVVGNRFSGGGDAGEGEQFKVGTVAGEEERGLLSEGPGWAEVCDAMRSIGWTW